MRDYSYVFQFKDIWNNVRLSYSDGDLNGAIDPESEIIQEKNYYPFGLVQKGYNNVVEGGNSTAQNFKTYQDQEFNEDLGLNVHEWKYRISDPAIGRFWQIDPLAEDYVYNSPYAFQENKLGSGIELEGLENLDWEQQQFLGMSKEFQGILSAAGSVVDKFFASFTTKTKTKVASTGSGDTSVSTTVSHTETTTVSTNLESFINDIQVGEDGTGIMPNTPMINVDETSTTTLDNTAKLEVNVRGPVSVTEELGTKTDLSTQETSLTGKVSLGVNQGGNNLGLFASGKTSSDGTTVKAGVQATVNNSATNTSTGLKIGVSHKIEENQ